MNINLISATRHMQSLLLELCDADVTVLAARLNMNYNTPKPHPFHFYIHAWNDENFNLWAVQYHAIEDEQKHKTSVTFLDGQVFALND